MTTLYLYMYNSLRLVSDQNDAGDPIYAVGAGRRPDWAKASMCVCVCVCVCVCLQCIFTSFITLEVFLLYTHLPIFQLPPFSPLQQSLMKHH